MERIVRWCLKNKSVVILATVLLIGSGAYATTRLNQELLPNISFPIITISTPWPAPGLISSTSRSRSPSRTP
jgi:multidrug efflux pump subunit AcrB